jgi:hypothetical protein
MILRRTAVVGPVVGPVVVWMFGTLLWSMSAAADWGGFEDRSDALGTERFDFGAPGGGNENYYDGDMGDFDGDGLIDRAVISRYGLLWNAGGGEFFPVSTQQVGQPPGSSTSLTGYLFGDEMSIGNDAVQWVDVDGDGDLDSFQGGNGERFILQENREGRFSIRQAFDGSALNIVNIDLERDGDADLVVAHAFCTDSPDPGCGGPLDFNIWVNDGDGGYREESSQRGLDLASEQIAGVATGDVDGDGDFDILLLHGAQDSLAICENDGTGRFSVTLQPFASRLAVSGFGQHLNLGDIDDDGDLDVAVVMGRYTGTHPRVGHVIMVNDGVGNFVEESDTRFVVPERTGFSGRLTGGNGKLADLDYDGDLDFLVFSMMGSDDLHLQIFLNDGTGVFTYDQSYAPAIDVVDTEIGNDTDITDLDDDGVYDLWVGNGGDRVRILVNTYDPPDGRRPDVPRDLEVVSAETGGVRLSWTAPSFAATARHYRVYRSLAPNLLPSDRALLRVVALSRHEDEGFSAPISRFTTTQDLGDPDVALDGAEERIELTDRAVEPGINYFYTVAHVGTENTVSAHTPEALAMVPPLAGADDATGPTLRILSPTADAWSAYPRIVLEYADGGSGVDLSTLLVSFDRPVGDRAAGSDLRDLAVRMDDSACVIPLRDAHALSSGPARLTASLADRAGNRTESSLAFDVSVVSARPPAAYVGAEQTSGAAPFQLSAWGSDSTDDDGVVMRWEWHFGDGRSALGRSVGHCYGQAGSYEVMLLVRDNEGAVASANLPISVFEGSGERCPDDPGGGDGDSDADADADSDRDAGTDGPPPIPAVPVDAGCGCRVGAASATSGSAFLWLLSLALVRRRSPAR